MPGQLWLTDSMILLLFGYEDYGISERVDPLEAHPSGRSHWSQHDRSDFSLQASAPRANGKYLYNHSRDHYGRSRGGAGAKKEGLVYKY